MKYPKVLVTGAGGFVGKNLVPYMKNLGYEPISWSKKTYNLCRENHAEDLFTVAKAAGAKACIHLAANCGGIGLNQKKPADLFHDNMQMGMNVIINAARCGMKVVNLSTICAYPCVPPRIPFMEEDLWMGYPEPTNAPYAIAKKAVMVMGNAYRQQYGLNFVTLMPTNVYGPCFSTDTEVMTVAGLKNIKDIKIDEEVYTLNPDTHEVEITKVIATQHNKTNEWINFNAASVDFKVTPDHKIYYKTNTNFQKREARYFKKYIGKQYGQINLATHNETKFDENYPEFISLENYIDENHLVNNIDKTVRDYNHSHSKAFPFIYNPGDFCEFLGWLISEGSLEDTHGQIRISQSMSANLYNVYRIGNLLVRMGIEHGYDGKAFYFTSRLIGKYIKNNIGQGSENKKIPSFILEKSFPNELRKRIFDSLMAGDGNKNGRRYTTKSNKLKDDFVHLAFLLGIKTNVNLDESNCWRISLSNERNLVTVKSAGISSNNVENEDSYCITTEKNHIIYAGRNGTLNWIGQCDHFNETTSHVIPALITKFQRAIDNGDDVVKCWGTGTPTREFLYVEDLCNAIVRALEYYDKPDPVNISGGDDGEVSIKDLTHYISKYMNYNGDVIWDDTRADGQPRRKLDGGKAMKYFGYASKVWFEDGLKKTIQWYKENQNANT